MIYFNRSTVTKEVHLNINPPFLCFNNVGEDVTEPSVNISSSAKLSVSLTENRSGHIPRDRLNKLPLSQDSDTNNLILNFKLNTIIFILFRLGWSTWVYDWTVELFYPVHTQRQFLLLQLDFPLQEKKTFTLCCLMLGRHQKLIDKMFLLLWTKWSTMTVWRRSLVGLKGEKATMC